MKYYEVVHSYNVAGGHGGERNRSGETKVVAVCASRDLAEKVVKEYRQPVHWREAVNSGRVRQDASSGLFPASGWAPPHDKSRYCGELFIREREMSVTLEEAENNINAWWLGYKQYDGRRVDHGVHANMHFYWKGEEDGSAEEKEEQTSGSIEELELSVRAYNCLMRAGITTIADLCSKTPTDLKAIRNMGAKSEAEIVEKLRNRGLQLKEEFR